MTLRKNINLEKTIAKLYIYLLPVRMIEILSILQNSLHGAALYFDFVLNIIGVIMYIVSCKGNISIKKDRSGNVQISLLRLVLYLNISSLFMAVLTQIKYGDYAGRESAFSGISGMMIYFFQYFVIFWYNSHVFELISKEELEKIFQRITTGMIALGYFQIAVHLIGGVLFTIEQRLDILGILYINENGKGISLLASEPAEAGGQIILLCLTFLYAKTIVERHKVKYVVQIILCLPIIYFTNSSTTYIEFVTCSCIFLILYCKLNSRKKSVVFLEVCIILIAIIVIISPSVLLGILPDSIRDNIQYTLFNKIFDRSNGSTASRTVPFYVNWGAFTESPIIGVGNGLQGYYYIKYFPVWGFKVVGSDIMDFYNTAKTSIVNGALFLPSLFSGYGLLGGGLIFVWGNRLVKLANYGKNQMGAFYYMFIMSIFVFLVIGMQSEVCGCYYIWFMLSLPLMVRNKIENEVREYVYNCSNYSVDTNNE